MRRLHTLALLALPWAIGCRFEAPASSPVDPPAAPADAAELDLGTPDAGTSADAGDRPDAPSFADADPGDRLDAEPADGAGPDAVDGGGDAGSADARIDGGRPDTGVPPFPITVSNVDPDLIPAATGALIVRSGDRCQILATAAPSIGGSCSGSPPQPIATVQLDGSPVVVLRVSSLLVEGRGAFSGVGVLAIDGDRPLVLLVEGDTTIDGIADASANFDVAGPGSGTATCAGAGGSGARASDAGGGGGGGALGSNAGRGGQSASGGSGGGAGSTFGSDRIEPLAGGCRGGDGGDGNLGPGGRGGGGGGALQISSGGRLRLAGVVVSAGGGGRGGERRAGGGGGGSGGTVLLEASILDLDSGAGILTGGGSGGEGGSAFTTSIGGADGENGHLNDTAPAQTISANASGGDGGAGGVSTSQPGAGQSGQDGNGGGGGGGGSVGRIRLRGVGACTVEPGFTLVGAARRDCP